MLAFILRHTEDNYLNNILVVSKTKEEAVEYTNNFKEKSHRKYNKLEEVEIKNLTVFGLKMVFMENVGNDYFKIDNQLTGANAFNVNKKDNYLEPLFTIEIDEVCPNIVYMVETLNTHKEMIKLFKEQNSKILDELF